MELGDEMSKLYNLAELIQSEIEDVICAYAFWKKMYDERKSENTARLTMRTLFFREAVLGITRIWDVSGRNKKSLSVIRINNLLSDKRIVTAVSKRNSDEYTRMCERMNSPLREHLATYAEKTRIEREESIAIDIKSISNIVNKYAQGDSEIVSKFRDIRDKLIAHRELGYTPNSHQSIESFYQIYSDTAQIVEKLTSILGCEDWRRDRMERFVLERAQTMYDNIVSRPDQ